MDLLELRGTPGPAPSTRHLTFQTEDFAPFYEEAKPLIRMHWEEVAPHKDLCWLNPNLVFYYQAADKGILHIVTARDGKKLVGYVWMMLHPHVHYQHAALAREDIHFLHPDYRKGMNGINLFKATERIMKAKGAKIMVLGCKVEHDHGVLFERMGYSALDVTYSKRLDT